MGPKAGLCLLEKFRIVPDIFFPLLIFISPGTTTFVYSFLRLYTKSPTVVCRPHNNTSINGDLSSSYFIMLYIYTLSSNVYYSSLKM
jgi:hypothetical protein